MFRMARSIRWAWPTVVVLGAACSAHPSGGGGAVADQTWTDLATAICNQLGVCTPFVLQADYGDTQTCLRRQMLALPKVFSGPGSGTTPSNVEACVQAYATASCADLIAGTTPAACNIHGSLPQGAACGDDSQCAGANSYCNLGDSQTCGVCDTRAAAGDACAFDSDCESGMVCGMAANAATGACVATAGVGGACSDSTPCAFPLVCSSADPDAGSGSCAQPAEVGASCDPVAQNCNGIENLLCDPTTNVCTAQPTAGSGAQCGFLGNGFASYTMCVGGAYCDLADSGFSGTCVPRAAEGAPCDPTETTGPLCLAPAVCAVPLTSGSPNGVCTLRDSSACQ
jgi:hypothetical protein